MFQGNNNFESGEYWRLFQEFDLISYFWKTIISEPPYIITSEIFVVRPFKPNTHAFQICNLHHPPLWDKFIGSLYINLLNKFNINPVSACNFVRIVIKLLISYFFISFIFWNNWWCISASFIGRIWAPGDDKRKTRSLASCGSVEKENRQGTC